MSSTTATSSLRSLGRRISGSPHVWGVLGIVLLLAVNVAKDSSYLSISYDGDRGALVGNVIDILRAASPILMVSIGMCLVVATSGIDLSVGSMMVVGGAVAMQFLHDVDSPESVAAAAMAIALALGLCMLLGAINGGIVTFVGLQPFITTLVMLLVARGLAKVITSGQNTSATNDPYRWIANGYILGIPVVFLIAISVVLVVGVIVRRTALGMMIEAIGINSEASRLTGLNRNGLLLTVYVFSAVLGGIAGVFATSSVMTVDVSQTGNQVELDAILAVVIGGTSLAGGKFSLTGAAIGAFMIATLDKTVLFLGIPSSVTPAFKALVIVVLYLIQTNRVGAVVRAVRRSPTRSGRASEVAA